MPQQIAHDRIFVPLLGGVRQSLTGISDICFIGCLEQRLPAEKILIEGRGPR